MRARTQGIGVVVGCAMALWAAPKGAHAKSRRVGTTQVNRPLVLPEGVLRIDAGPRRPMAGGQLTSAGQLQFHVIEGAEDLAFAVPGAGYGLTKDIEIGAVWPLRMAPDLDLADISMYGRFRLLDGSVELAGYGELLVPIESDLALTAGAPARIHLSPTLRLDTGAFLRLVFAAEPIGIVNVPAAALFQLDSRWALGVESGIQVVDFDDLRLPVGVVGSYNLASGLGTLGEVFGRIGVENIGSGTDYMRVDLGAELYWDL